GVVLPLERNRPDVPTRLLVALTEHQQAIIGRDSVGPVDSLTPPQKLRPTPVERYRVEVEGSFWSSRAVHDARSVLKPRRRTGVAIRGGRHPGVSLEIAEPHIGRSALDRNRQASPVRGKG